MIRTALDQGGAAEQPNGRGQARSSLRQRRSHSTSGSSWVINAISNPVTTPKYCRRDCPSGTAGARRNISLKPLISNTARYQLSHR